MKKLFLLLLFFYVILTIPALTSIPVFADEAIYIRWAQLILSDPQQYLFFSLNDGKTPLFIWLLTPFLRIFSDPLMAGRALSVCVGAGQVMAVVMLAQTIKLSKQTQLFSGMLAASLPIFLIHNRLAVMDGLLTLLVTLSALFFLRYTQYLSSNKLSITRAYICSRWLWMAAGCFFLALMSKLTAVIAFPVVVLIGFFPFKFSSRGMQQWLLVGALFGGISMGLFSLLALHPAFPQLFSRGGDFLRPISSLFHSSFVYRSAGNLRFILSVFWQYFTPGFSILLVASILLKKKSTTLLLLAGSSFLSPLILLADVLHSRYLLPAVPFFAIAVGSVLEASYQQLTKQFKAPLVIQCLLFTLFVPSLLFLYQLWTNPISANWVADDESQLFTSWSSGHGIKEVSTLILEESRSTPVAVATEGYFGTLPDGILMYLFGKSGEYYVEGIGQPVREVSGKYARLSQGYEKKWLVVNSHRLDMQLPPELLISEFCRPLSAPCLQLWDVSSIAPTQSKEVLP